MKKLLAAFLAFTIMGTTLASAPYNTNPIAPNASQIMIPVGKDGKKISLLELSTINRADLENLTGRKMNWAEKLAFKNGQKKIRKGINDKGEVTSKKMQKMFYADGESGFHLGGFALGFLVGLIGVLIAYLIKDDYKSNRVKWAWIGLGAAVVLGLVVALAIL